MPSVTEPRGCASGLLKERVHLEDKMVGWGIMDWGNLAEDKNKCWVLRLWVSYNVGNFFTSFLQEDCPAWCGLFPMCFLTKTSYEFLVSFASAACSSLLVFLHLFTTTLLGGSYKLLSSHYVIFSTSFTVNFFMHSIFLVHIFFQTPQLSVQVLVMCVSVFSIVY